MAGEWRDSTWGDEIVLEYGKALRGYNESSGHYQVFGANGPIGWTDEPLVPGPGVILGRKGAYRGVEYSLNPFFVSTLPTMSYPSMGITCDGSTMQSSITS